MARFVTADGTGIAYEAGGSGQPPLVFVHGWCSRRGHWRAQLDHFAARHRVLAADRRGHGDSEAPERPASVAGHADDLAALMRDQGFADAVVVAHAGGGPTGLALACAHSELVRALVLVDTHVGPAARFEDPDDPAGAALGAMIAGLEGERGADYLAATYAGFFSEHAGEAGRRALAEALETPLRVAAAELRSIGIDTLALAREVRQPVLWLSVAAADQAGLSDAFRDIRFGQVVGSGHFPQLEEPEQVDAMIARFVAML